MDFAFALRRAGVGVTTYKGGKALWDSKEISPLGVQVCEATGRVAQILNPLEHGALMGLAFGGPDLNWLYVAEGGKLFRRPVKVKGNVAWAR
ncbi:MAG: hypothetical protein ACLQU1_41975 [Bryobacteraceae bacterium]